MPGRRRQQQAGIDLFRALGAGQELTQRAGRFVTVDYAGLNVTWGIWRWRAARWRAVAATGELAGRQRPLHCGQTRVLNWRAETTSTPTPATGARFSTALPPRRRWPGGDHRRVSATSPPGRRTTAVRPAGAHSPWCRRTGFHPCAAPGWEKSTPLDKTYTCASFATVSHRGYRMLHRRPPGRAVELIK